MEAGISTGGGKSFKILQSGGTINPYSRILLSTGSSHLTVPMRAVYSVDKSPHNLVLQARMTVTKGTRKSQIKLHNKFCIRLSYSILIFNFSSNNDKNLMLNHLLDRCDDPCNKNQVK